MASEEPPIYFILGHGDDTVDFEKRAQLPRGYTMVTFCNCNEYVQAPDMCPFFNLFAKTDEGTKRLLLNPDLLASMPEFREYNIRIYKEGYKVPSLYTTLKTAWNSDEEPTSNEEDVAYICKSGVFRYPIPHEALYSREEDFLCGGDEPVSFCSDKTLSFERAHSGSMNSRFRASRSAMLGYSSNKIMEIGGPGIYYFPICRKGQCSVKSEFEEGEERDRAMEEYHEKVRMIRSLSDRQLRDTTTPRRVPPAFRLSDYQRIRMETNLRNPSKTEAEKEEIRNRLAEDDYVREHFGGRMRSNKRRRRRSTRNKRTIRKRTKQKKSKKSRKRKTRRRKRSSRRSRRV